MKDLELELLHTLHGGESIWYWISYGTSSAARMISEIDLSSGPYEWSPARPYG